MCCLGRWYCSERGMDRSTHSIQHASECRFKTEADRNFGYVCFLITLSCRLILQVQPQYTWPSKLASIFSIKLTTRFVLYLLLPRGFGRWIVVQAKDLLFKVRNCRSLLWYLKNFGFFLLQEYPPGVFVAPMDSATVRPFSKTNLVVMAPTAPLHHPIGTTMAVACGDALICDPGCYPAAAHTQVNSRLCLYAI